VVHSFRWVSFPRFSLRTLLVVMTLAACCLGASRYVKVASPPSSLECVCPSVVILTDDKEGIVEVSAGDDDGLRPDHRGMVFRGDNFLGDVVILRTSSDRSVGRVEFSRELKIRKGDKVYFGSIFK